MGVHRTSFHDIGKPYGTFAGVDLTLVCYRITRKHTGGKITKLLNTFEAKSGTTVASCDRPFTVSSEKCCVVTLVVRVVKGIDSHERKIIAENEYDT